MTLRILANVVALFKFLDSDIKYLFLNEILDVFSRENSDFPCYHFHHAKSPGQDSVRALLFFCFF